jgi:hypothetical protein
MTERRSSADLGPNLETVLGGFPFPERDWEQAASLVESRIAETTLGSTDAALLAAPLPSEPGEPSFAPSATATPLANSGVRTQSLAELARRSVENKQASKREMARASLALAAELRPNAEQALALREAISSKLPLAAPSAAASPRAPLASRTVAVLPTPVNAPSTAVSTANPWPKLGAAAAAIALAAGALFWLRQPAPAPMLGTVPPAAVGRTKVSTGNDATTAAPLATQPVPSGVDPSTLPGESAGKPVDAAHEKAAVARAAATSAPGAAASAEKIVLDDEPRAAASAVARSPEQAVEKTLPPDPALRPADSTSGALPGKPSTGAVQAALGAVMSGARHCVAGEEAPSSAIVVFGSDGRVRSVAVSGSASGKSSGACIEAQLGRARVQPFAASSFSVSATVRPD